MPFNYAPEKVLFAGRLRKKEGFVHFDGTVLRSPSGRRCVLTLNWQAVNWRGGGRHGYLVDRRWDWGYDWLDSDWGADNLSAVLAS